MVEVREGYLVLRRSADQGGKTREETKVCEAIENGEDVVRTDGTEARDNDTGKKRWSTPKLRTFVRARREERVLDYCKQYGSGVGIYGTYTGCTGKYTCGSRCYDWGS